MIGSSRGSSEVRNGSDGGSGSSSGKSSQPPDLIETDMNKICGGIQKRTASCPYTKLHTQALPTYRWCYMGVQLRAYSRTDKL